MSGFCLLERWWVFALWKRACVFSEQGGARQLALFSVGRLFWNPGGRRTGMPQD